MSSMYIFYTALVASFERYKVASMVSRSGTYVNTVYSINPLNKFDDPYINIIYGQRFLYLWHLLDIIVQPTDLL